MRIACFWVKERVFWSLGRCVGRGARGWIRVCFLTSCEEVLYERNGVYVMERKKLFVGAVEMDGSWSVLDTATKEAATFKSAYDPGLAPEPQSILVSHLDVRTLSATSPR